MIPNAVHKRFLKTLRTRGPRNTKGYDWYYNAKARLELQETHETNLPAVDMFPQPAYFKRARAFLEFSNKKQVLGKCTFVLISDLLPITCKNFLDLCEGKNSPFCYRGTPVHRIAKDGVIMSGDVELQTGESGHSAYETRFFDDEAFVGLHNARGVLSMTNGGIHTNNSQFFITLSPQPQLNGRNVAFGYVENGMETLNKLTLQYTHLQKPLEPIFISSCGPIPE